MTRKKRKEILIDWLTNGKGWSHDGIDKDGCKIYIKDTKNTRLQIDVYDDEFDMVFSKWDKDDNMTDITELYSLPFPNNSKQLDDLMILVKSKK